MPPGGPVVLFPSHALGWIMRAMSDETPERRRYRFSLRTLLLVIAMALVALGGWVQFLRQQSRVRSLENDNLALRDALGYLEDSDDGDHYRLTQLGANLDNETSTILTGSHLLRVEHHEKYALELTFYDSETQERKTETVDLNDPVVAITYLPFKWGKSFFVQSTYLTNRKTNLVFEVATHDELSFNPSESGYSITDECILHYFFYDSKRVNDGPTISETRHLTPEEMFQLCDKYHMQSVFFRIVPRNGN